MEYCFQELSNRSIVICKDNFSWSCSKHCTSTTLLVATNKRRLTQIFNIQMIQPPLAVPILLGALRACFATVFCRDSGANYPAFVICSYVPPVWLMNMIAQLVAYQTTCFYFLPFVSISQRYAGTQLLSCVYAVHLSGYAYTSIKWQFCNRR